MKRERKMVEREMALRWIPGGFLNRKKRRLTFDFSCQNGRPTPQTKTTQRGFASLAAKDGFVHAVIVAS